MGDTDTEEQQEREIRDVVLRRDDNGEPSWTIRMYVPSADLVALGTSRLLDLEESRPAEVLEVIQEVLQQFIRPLIVDGADSRAVDRELYRQAHRGSDWIAWLLKAAIFGDAEADGGNREQRRAAARGGGRGGRGGSHGGRGRRR